MPDGSGTEIVTLKDVFMAVQSVDGRLRTVESDIRSVRDHEERIRTLERWMYALPPTFLVAVASIVITLVK